MSNFSVNSTDPYSDVVSSLNYVLANLNSTTLTDATVLVANVQNGQITSNNNVVSYLYQYMDVQYANNSTGSSGFSSNCVNRSYYGLRNTANTAISTNPTDYIWYQVTGGFGTTKNLWYNTYGGRAISLFANSTAPAANYIPTVDNQPINLDIITGTAANEIINVNAYFASNSTPSTPTGGYYDFSTVTLTPPVGWTANIPTTGNTTVWISSDVFQGNSTANVGPSRPWTTPAPFITQFNANAGPAGSRGFVPMGFVMTPSDPTVASNSTLTGWFSNSRSNSSPPIGLGYAPIANDTAQFAYQNLFTGNTTTIVKTFDGNVWSSVVGNVISGGLFVPGSINANTLNVNQVYAINIQSTNATIGNVSSPGYWLQANTGDARFGGNVNIGANLNVSGLITASGLLSNTVSTPTMVLNSATQQVFVQDDPAVNTVPFVNGNTQVITAPGYLWPYNTRGFGVGGGVTINPTTTGAVGASGIQVNYNAYVNALNYPTYNLIELWKSGTSKSYQNIFRSVTAANGDSADVNKFLIVGDSGSAGVITGNAFTLLSSTGNWSPTQPAVTTTLYTGWEWFVNSGTPTPAVDPTYLAWGGNAAIWNNSSTTIGITKFPPAGITTYGVSLIDVAGGPTLVQSGIAVANGGQIYRTSTHVQGTYPGDINTIESSGVFSDLYSVASDFGSNASTYITSSATSVAFVAVGSGGTILKNSRTFVTTGNSSNPANGNVNSTSGWTISTSNVTVNLNSVGSNSYSTGTGRGNAWVIAGDTGTILNATSAGPGTPPAVWYPRTSNVAVNLYGVAECKGRWIAVGAGGVMLTSTDGGVTWSAPVTNPADGSGAIGVRDLYGIAGDTTTGRWVASGQEVVMLSNTNDPSAGWTVSYDGGLTVQSDLTRLVYNGSWSNIANISQPLPQQQISNQQIISGTYVDYAYTANNPVTYYLVLGNLKGDTVYTGGPSILATEIKR